MLCAAAIKHVRQNDATSTHPPTAAAAGGGGGGGGDGDTMNIRVGLAAATRIRSAGAAVRRSLSGAPCGS